MRKDKRITIRISDDTYEYVKLLSEQRGVPMAKIIREMLERYINRQY